MFLGELGSFISSLSGQSPSLPAVLASWNTAELKHVELPQPHHLWTTHCVCPRGFAAVLTCCLPRFPTAPLPPSRLRRRKKHGKLAGGQGAPELPGVIPGMLCSTAAGQGLGGDGALCFQHPRSALGCPFPWFSASLQWGCFRASGGCVG